MSAAREVKDPASARREVRPEGRVRARTAAPTRNNRVSDGGQRGARSARCRANLEAADALVLTRRVAHKEAAE